MAIKSEKYLWKSRPWFLIKLIDKIWVIELIAVRFIGIRRHNQATHDVAKPWGRVKDFTSGYTVLDTPPRFCLWVIKAESPRVAFPPHSILVTTSGQSVPKWKNYIKTAWYKIVSGRVSYSSHTPLIGLYRGTKNVSIMNLAPSFHPSIKRSRVSVSRISLCAFISWENKCFSSPPK